MSYQYDEHDSAGEAVDDFNDSTNRFAFTEKSIRLGLIFL